MEQPDPSHAVEQAKMMSLLQQDASGHLSIPVVFTMCCFIIQIRSGEVQAQFLGDLGATGPAGSPWGCQIVMGNVNFQHYVHQAQHPNPTQITHPI